MISSKNQPSNNMLSKFFKELQIESFQLTTMMMISIACFVLHSYINETREVLFTEWHQCAKVQFSVPKD